jgi:hypothetical protein
MISAMCLTRFGAKPCSVSSNSIVSVSLHPKGTNGRSNRSEPEAIDLLIGWLGNVVCLFGLLDVCRHGQHMGLGRFDLGWGQPRRRCWQLSGGME